MKYLIHLSIILIFFSCAGQTKFQPEDLIFTKEDFYRSPKKILSNTEILHDVDMLIYAMENGYGAKGFLPRGQFKKAISSLNKIKNYNELSEEEFCKKIGDILWPIQDGHLSVRSRGKLCGKQQRWNEIKGQVGPNFASKINQKNNRPWHIEIREVKKKKVGLISITSYPNHKNLIWGDFLTKAKSLLKLDGIIIDLRGNTGGDDTTGFMLAEIMQDRKVMPGWDKTIENLSAQTIALSKNNFNIQKLWLEKNNKPVPEYVMNFLDQRDKLLREIKAGMHKEQKIYTWNQKDYPLGKNMYQGKVAILSDRKCGSSGESSLEAFAKHPNAKIYGENSAGKYHFGNVSNLILTHSKVSIILASKYNAYRDGRNIDKVGLSPDVHVPKGRDALDVALNNMFN